MELKLLHFYPDLMSLYGSYANVSILKRTLEAMGNTVAVERVRPGEDANIADVDFIYMGAGTERRKRPRWADFARYGAAVKAAAENGTAMLFAGNSMELLGASITDDAGKVYAGIGLADFTAVQGKKRFVEDVYGHTALFEDAVVGFVNRCSVLTGVKTPLLTDMELGCRQRGPLRPGGLSQRQRVHKSAHRPYFSEESGAAADHGADHLQASGRKLPGGAGGQLHDAGLGHHGRAAKGPLPEIRKKK